MNLFYWIYIYMKYFIKEKNLDKSYIKNWETKKGGFFKNVIGGIFSLLLKK